MYTMPAVMYLIAKLIYYVYIYIFIHHMWYIYIDSFFFHVIFYVILHFQINIIIPNLAARKQYQDQASKPRP